jgi:tetratricopeptide (TPR) repeat protein
MSADRPLASRRSLSIGVDSDVYDARSQDMGLGIGSIVAVVAYAAVAACDRPENSNDYFDRGVDRLQAGKYKGAIADFDQAINIRPKYTNAYINRADAKIRLGQYKEAIADYDQAIRLQPDEALAYYRRGEGQFRFEHYQEAIADFDQAIHLRTHYVGAYIGRGNAKIGLGQYEEAIADLKAALEQADQTDDSDFIAAIEGKIEELEQDE